MNYYRNCKKDVINNINEIYKEYPFNKNYMVSNFGSVYSKNGYKISSFINRTGYEYVKIDSKNTAVHRLVLLSFDLNENHNILDVNHINGLKTDNRLINLEWCTRSENCIHAVNTGLSKIGEDHPNSTHSNDEVIYICTLIKNGYSAREISEFLNIDCNPNFRKFISKIKHGYLWKNIYNQI